MQEDKQEWDSREERMDSLAGLACQVAFRVGLLLVPQFLLVGQHWEFQE
jgi:hypothetical protein